MVMSVDSKMSCNTTFPLPDFIDRVKAGEEFVITRQGNGDARQPHTATPVVRPDILHRDAANRSVSRLERWGYSRTIGGDHYAGLISWTSDKHSRFDRSVRSVLNLDAINGSATIFTAINCRDIKTSVRSLHDRAS